MVRLTQNDVHDYINGICFKTGPPGKVGVETEWLVVDPGRPDEPVPLDRLAALVETTRPLPSGSVLSFEPGGQLELSSPALPGPASAHAALACDLAHVSKILGEDGLRLSGSALDPRRAPVRQLALPRYTAMEHFFASRGEASGRTMMCSTASLQVCLDIGADAAETRRRWELLHRLGPVLVAAFANSPLWRGRPTGWRSTRWVIWAATDASRTRPAAGEGPDGAGDPARIWTRYALDAQVMAVPSPTGPWQAVPGLTFGEWLEGGGPRLPTADDLVYHLSTLFPPIRPRGWWELRMIDALPERWWPVPVAVASALLDDPRAHAAAAAATADLCGGPAGGSPPGRRLWLAAARDGLTDPALARCARACFAAAAEALPGMGAAHLAATVDAYRERYVERGRCPADEGLSAGTPDDHPCGGTT